MYEINGHKLLQYPGELEELIAIFAAENVRSYLEIGCKYGGSLWKIGKALPKGSRIVAVDLMLYPDIAGPLKKAADDLTGIDVRLIKGNSADPAIIKQVQDLGPFDACLIDGDHELAGVTSDWRNYGSLCRVVAFHDINWYRPEGHPQARKYPIHVPQLWNEIKKEFRHVEIKRDKQDNGIGVLWH